MRSSANSLTVSSESQNTQNRDMPAGPSRATAGPGKPLLRGPITTTQPHSVGLCAEIEMLALRGRKRGEGSPLTIRLWAWGSFGSSPSGVRGGAPARKWILCIFEVRKKPSETPFSVLWAMAGPPNVAGPGETPPLLDGPACRFQDLQTFNIAGSHGSRNNFRELVNLFYRKSSGNICAYTDLAFRRVSWSACTVPVHPLEASPFQPY